MADQWFVVDVFATPDIRRYKNQYKQIRQVYHGPIWFVFENAVIKPTKLWAKCQQP